MVCIYCGGNTRVINSRPQPRNNQVWRRRFCPVCQAIFTTYEQADLVHNWTVKAASGKPSGFMEEKLFLSIYESLKHRPSAIVDAINLTKTVIQKINRSAKHGVIDANLISKITLVCLNRFDKVASTHYQAFHDL
ncbi:hypothetical protein M1512_02805 [Patescibacteria group bacterium]|nr:hypothetical protein [Patescibacteria group bacterium]